MKPSEFVGLLFLARDVTHSTHLNTRSYAKHKALQGFYEGIVGLADSFAEAYQGRHGLIGPVTLMAFKPTKNVTEFLEAQLREVEANRYKVCEERDTSIQNIIDEIVGLYLRTLYKLKFLV